MSTNTTPIVFDEKETKKDIDPSFSELQTSPEFASYLKNFDYVIVKFGAEWCGPCKRIQPEFEKLSKEIVKNEKLSIKFVGVNTDKFRKITQKCEVKNLPTFVVFVSGQPSRSFEAGAGFVSLKKFCIDLMNQKKKDSIASLLSL